MLQRIQTVYLLAAALFGLLLLFMPLATFPEGAAELRPFTHADGLDELPYSLLLLLSVGLALGAIFLYGNRALQMRLTIFNLLVSLGSMALVYFLATSLEGQAPSFGLAASFPLVVAILCYMAFRGIRRDEELVRSADRIR